MNTTKSKEVVEDERIAQDMQLAFELQASENRKARRRQIKRTTREATENIMEYRFDLKKLKADHMIFVSCILDGKILELLVDSGASCSAISIDMAISLGLAGKINRTVYGDAKGVGSSNILGIIENVELMVSHVELRLFFVVIDSALPCCILGLDQMRRFKCLIDLDSNVLIFGGKGGVSVPFLSREEAHAVTAKMVSSTSNSGSSSLFDDTSRRAAGIGKKIKSLFKF
mmetsp:Transcript_25705/g.56369  ORF Transcript_25705/g.56369 Transcript_25705/m.56369 type:complete len:229 (-) Transcript_25705:618-1304(-)